MKEIAVVANEKIYAEYLKENLNDFFEDYAVINSYCVEEVEQLDCIRETYVVISAFTIFHQVKRKLKSDAELVIVSLSLNADYLHSLDNLKKGEKALLVNIDYNHCSQVISMIYSAGYKDLELYPYCPGIGDFDPLITTAITPHELDIVPERMRKVIDIGERVIDINCIIMIAQHLDVKNPFEGERATKARARIALPNISIEKMLGENESLDQHINMLIDMVDKGIIIIDTTGKVHISNEKALAFFNKRTDVINGFNIVEILPEIDFDISEIVEEKKRENLIGIDGTDYSVTLTPIVIKENIRGVILQLESFVEMEEKQHSIRNRLASGKLDARYNIDAIIGKSILIQESKSKIERFARSSASILITGESGTGKEVFAQAAHNLSKRSKYNFVAVNCAAIPESLLESEMFGHEEGAFTGARKGGKIGYFELAHKGTIFLDEIAEMPLALQSKLLRVIEEKKIVKVGSNKVIDVDVRIICATNKNLLKLIDENKFREDLYYRINVLPMKLPSLRERGEDIVPLIEHFMSSSDYKFEINKEAKMALKQYNFRGNIRELRNIVEYMGALEKDTICLKDLELDFGQLSTRAVCENKKSEKQWHEDILKFRYAEESNIENYRIILELIERENLGRRNIGRQRAVELAEDNGVFVTEQEIRGMLEKLKQKDFINQGKGPRGARITDKGKEFLESLKG